MASIDRADWHYGNEFPKNLPLESSGTHIGMYLNWIIDSELIGQMHIEGNPEAIEKVKAGKMSGRDFFFEYCDGKFWSDDMNELGNEFTEKYYSNKYFKDYAEILSINVESIYHVENSRYNYEKIKAKIDMRFQKWNNRKNRNFWEFWK